MWLEYVKSVMELKKKLPSSDDVLGAGDDVIGMDQFVLQFGDLYRSNPEIRQSLLMCLMRSLVTKSSGHMNAPLESVLIDFYLMLASYGRKVFKLVAGM